MPISPYIAALRARLGSTRLLLPSVTGVVYDSDGGILLVCQREGAIWSTPGGVIEPDETPADAVVREVREETGLLVRPDRPPRAGTRE
jgi:8-oxo-dGTP diphosphatase